MYCVFKIFETYFIYLVHMYDVIVDCFSSHIYIVFFRRTSNFHLIFLLLRFNRLNSEVKRMGCILCFYIVNLQTYFWNCMKLSPQFSMIANVSRNGDHVPFDIISQLFTELVCADLFSYQCNYIWVLKT